MILGLLTPLATITVIGRDKTGVIARVTGFLFERGANLEALEERLHLGRADDEAAALKIGF